jgi:hypothetical protein
LAAPGPVDHGVREVAAHGVDRAVEITLDMVRIPA